MACRPVSATSSIRNQSSSIYIARVDLYIQDGRKCWCTQAPIPAPVQGTQSPDIFQGPRHPSPDTCPGPRHRNPDIFQGPRHPSLSTCPGPRHPSPDSCQASASLVVPVTNGTDTCTSGRTQLRDGGSTHLAQRAYDMPHVLKSQACRKVHTRRYTGRCIANSRYRAALQEVWYPAVSATLGCAERP